MGIIFSMGGGENGWGDTKYDMLKFDKEIVKLSNKKEPKILFIGFAAKNSKEYYQIIKRNFEYLNCVIYNIDDYVDANVDVLKDFIKGIDIVYVGGGNTNKLMQKIKRYNLEAILELAFEQGKVLSGVSAGAICWCKYGNSKTRRDKNGNWKPVRIKGLDFLPILFCPHIGKEPFRIDFTKKMILKDKNCLALTIDDAAIEVVDNKFKIIPLNEKAIAQTIEYYKNSFIFFSIPMNKSFDVNYLKTEWHEKRKDKWLLQD